MVNPHGVSRQIIINKERVLQRLIELCRICGASGNEKDVALYIQKFTEERVSSGLEIILFPADSIPDGGDTPNILFRIPGKKTGDIVLLSAHLDTVPVKNLEDRSIVISNGILKSNDNSILGGDDRAGVAAALEIADIALRYPENHAGLEILFTVQEELGCRGSGNLDRSMFRAQYGYNLDGETPPGSIIFRAPRKAKYSCEVYGKSSHAALAPEEGVSAIKIAGRIIDKLPQGQISPDSTANIGSVSGGSQTNIVPDFVIINGEVRSFLSEDFGNISSEIEDVCSLTAASLGGSCKITWEHSYFGYSVDLSGLCIKRFSEACIRCGIKPLILSSPGGGDSNNLNSIGMENVVFGLGMHEIHTASEYIVVDEFLSAMDILSSLIFFQAD
ncbi:MAG: M20/M25/M40 family metallo-hydrolase [Spirochaetales bacterium]|nr:M20/M25/M40 family metallo-hydrolase [Spirochaetales bacterium]